MIIPNDDCNIVMVVMMMMTIVNYFILFSVMH